MSIGERIRQRRKELNLSVDDIARKLGKNRATIYRYESDDIENLSITILEPLAKALETTPADLMGWPDTPNASLNTNQPDIQNKLTALLDELNPKSGHALKSGKKILTDSEKAILRISLENIVRLAKQMEK